MLLDVGVHLVRYTLMALAVLLICGGGIYFGYYKSQHQREALEGQSGESRRSSRRPDDHTPS